MKYMLLIYENEQALDDEIREDCYDESLQLVDRIRANAGSSSLPRRCTRPTRRRASACVTASRSSPTAPLPRRASSSAASSWSTSTNLDEAIEIASQIPGARRGTVEVRPVVELAGLKA